MLKVDGATPKRWLSKSGAMIDQYMGVAPSTFQVVHVIIIAWIVRGDRLDRLD